MVTDHVSRLSEKKKEELPLDDSSLDDKIFVLVKKNTLVCWLCQLLLLPKFYLQIWTTNVKRNSSLTLGITIEDEPLLFKRNTDRVF